MKNESLRMVTGKKYLLLLPKFLIIWVFLFAQTSAFAQVRSISGTVTGADNNPLPGVAVTVKGTTMGTNTDIEGKYTLSVPADGQTLVFSFIGMETVEVQLGTVTVYDVVLSESTIGLEEVVVIGYGTQKKADLTGSVVRVDMDDKAAVANITIGSALQGVTAGVNVGGVSTAGDEPDMSIRGKTSLSANDNPLIVLNGIIYNGSLSDININDVESIDVLKDASAAAVYGARSANGVMIITTKKGTSEKPLFNVNTYYGFQDFTNSPKRVMNGDEFANRLVDFYYQQNLYTWYATRPTSDAGKPVRGDINDRNYVASFLRTQEEKDNYLAGREVDWMKEIEQPAPIQNYDISVSGRTEKTNYYISGGYTDQKGRLLNDQFNRTSFHTTLENKITDWFTIGINSSYAVRDYSGIAASQSWALLASPLVDITTPQGTYPINLAMEASSYHHPLHLTVADNKDIRKSLFMLGYAKIEIPKIKGLIYDFNYSNTLNNSRDATYYPSTTSAGNSNRGQAYKNYSENTNWIINNIITFTRVFGNDHTVNSTLLYSREERSGETSALASSGFDNEILGYNGMELGTLQTVNTGGWEESSVAYMARVNYSYQSKYLLTATVRRDGFSGFGGNKKTATFPSLSLGWVLSEEAFLQNLKTINFLKLRTSVGVNGNQGIGRYSSFSKMSTQAYVFGSSTAIGLYPSSLGNSDLGWESTLSYNVGVDFGVLENRISGSIDVYKAETTDVLVSRALPGATGYANVWTNLGGISNKGIELSMTTINTKRLLQWESRFVFSLNRDKITKLYGGPEDRDLGNSWFVGEPISAIYNFKSDNTIWTEQEFYDGKILYPRTYPGHLKVLDLNGDDDIDATNDRTIVGYKAPNYRFSIGNNLSFKNFTLSVFLNAVMGGNGYYMADMGLNSFTTYAADVTGDAAIQYIYRNNNIMTRQYWTPDNGVTNSPSIYYLPYRNVGFYQSRGFVRLQDVALTYRIGSDKLSSLGIDGFQIYISGKNLHTWTNWEGFDPEFDDTTSRMMKNFILGARLSF